MCNYDADVIAAHGIRVTTEAEAMPRPVWRDTYTLVLRLAGDPCEYRQAIVTDDPAAVWEAVRTTVDILTEWSGPVEMLTLARV